MSTLLPCGCPLLEGDADLNYQRNRVVPRSLIPQLTIIRHLPGCPLFYAAHQMATDRAPPPRLWESPRLPADHSLALIDRPSETAPRAQALITTTATNQDDPTRSQAMGTRTAKKAEKDWAKKQTSKSTFKSRKISALDAKCISPNSFQQHDTEGIVSPTEYDVLSGRGVKTNYYPGNVRYRKFANSKKALYLQGTKWEKVAITRSIVAALCSVEPPVRFLAQDPRTGLYHDIGHVRTHDKVSNYLREGAPEARMSLMHAAQTVDDKVDTATLTTEDGTTGLKMLATISSLEKKTKEQANMPMDYDTLNNAFHANLEPYAGTLKGDRLIKKARAMDPFVFVASPSHAKTLQRRTKKMKNDIASQQCKKRSFVFVLISAPKRQRQTQSLQSGNGH